MTRWIVHVSIAALCSCRIGGPSTDPNAYVASDSGEDATVEGGHVNPGDDAPVASDDSSASSGDDSTTDAAGMPDTHGGGGGACDAAVAMCDPVHNTGCDPLHQCDVGISLTMMPTGNCVFFSGSDAGGACLMTGLTESCLPGHTCVGGACRALCFCNSDCPAGKSCSDTTSVMGFTLCAP